MTEDDGKVPHNEAKVSDASANMEASDARAIALAEKVAKLEEQIAILRNDYLRALADAQNAQARAERRIEQNTKYAITSFAKDLVIVTDDLNRVRQHISAEARAQNSLLDSLATGIEMTERALLSLLERYGLRRLQSLHQPFDPNFHQAVQEVEDKSVPSGTIIQVLQEGYVLHERLVRPAMVVVSYGGPKRQPTQQETSSTSCEQPTQECSNNTSPWKDPVEVSDADPQHRKDAKDLNDN